MDEKIESILKTSSKRYLLKSKSIISNEEIEVTYEVRLNENDSKFISQLTKVDGVTSAIMLSYDGNFTA